MRVEGRARQTQPSSPHGDWAPARQGGPATPLTPGSVGSKGPGRESPEWDPPSPLPARGSVSFPEGRGECISCLRAPSDLLGKVMLACFLTNVQSLCQNKPSNPHAVRAKLKTFKCSESRLLEGSRVT